MTLEDLTRRACAEDFDYEPVRRPDLEALVDGEACVLMFRDLMNGINLFVGWLDGGAFGCAYGNVPPRRQSLREEVIALNLLCQLPVAVGG